MPLPANGSGISWPPQHLHQVTGQLAEWSAWYAGDTGQLRNFYLRGTGPKTRPSQLAGGVVGAAARFFWGAPAPVGQQDTKLHVPVAADIATASADLLFSEDVSVTYDSSAEGVAEGVAEAAQLRLDAILDANNWASLLLEAADVASPLGGVYLRCTWDTSVDNLHPILSAVHADAAVPEFAYGRLQRVTFHREVRREDNGMVWRHLELHEPGRIAHGLYLGADDRLGTVRPLTDHPDTAGLAGAVDQQAEILTGYPGLSAVYIPNMRPNRLWRNLPQACHLGRADIAGVEGEMDALDETLTSWMRDVRLGKGRLIVPSYMLESTGPGSASSFYAEREVFQALNVMAPEGATMSQMLTAQQFAIRTAEHSQTMRELLGIIFRGAGYSASTFGLADAEGAQQTATEVSARERRSMTTREKKTRYWVDGLRQFLMAVAVIDAKQFGGKIPEGLQPVIEFAPTSTPTPDQTATTVQLWAAAEAVSTDTKVRTLHPDWDDTAVAEEVAKIMAEKNAAMPVDPFAGGAEGAGDPTAPEGMSNEELSEASEALGRLVRAGVDPSDAAARVGLAGVRFAGMPAV